MWTSWRCWCGWVRVPTSRISPALCTAALLGFVTCGPATADETSATDDIATPRGLKLGLVYDGAAFSNLRGGMRPGGTYTSNLNLQLTIDATPLFGWTDTIAYLDALWLHGDLP